MVERKNKRKTLQMIYDTNADYELTKEKITSTDYGYWFEYPDNPSGRCTISFFDKTYSDVVYFKKGTVQITYHSIKELGEIRNHISNLFITKEGNVAKLDNERPVNLPLYQQLKNLDLEIEKLRLEKDKLKEPTHLGYVAVTDKHGNLVHPLIPEIDKMISELGQRKYELFPWCEGPIEENEICDPCIRSQNPRYLQANFGPKPVKYCFLYDVRARAAYI